jgi:predicted transcriptional regulator
MTLTDADLTYLLTLLRSSDRPMTTEELAQALRERARG